MTENEDRGRLDPPEPKPEPCPTCEGKGHENGVRCSSCKGKGEERE